MADETAAHSDREHSDLVGGSSADQRLNCPASYQEEQKTPKNDKSSTYADEGTALHECMQFLLENNITDPDEVLGQVFGISETSPEGYKMTRALLDDAIIPCLDFFDALCDELEEEGGMQFLIECRSQMPGIPGAFGTSDIVFRTDKRSGVIDWKFGAGVQVKAAYETKVSDEEGETTELRPNSQPMFYGRASMFTFPKMFETDPDWPVDLYIVQPRSRFLQAGDPIFTHYQTNVKELEDFRYRLIAAIAEAQGKNPTHRKGPWCEFKRCKATCPLYTGPMLNLSKLDRKSLVSTVPEEAEQVALVDWGELFGQYLDMCDLAEGVIAEVRRQAHSFLEEGNGIKGWKLVPKQARDSYIDEPGMIRHAIGLGAKNEELYEAPALKSPAQMRDTVIAPLMEGATKKARTEEAKTQMKAFVSAISSGTTLAHDSDNRPSVVSTPQMVNELAKKLGAL